SDCASGSRWRLPDQGHWGGGPPPPSCWGCGPPPQNQVASVPGWQALHGGQPASVACPTVIFFTSSSALKRVTMPPSSWFLGTPGPTVACFRPLFEAPASLARACLASAPPVGASAPGAGTAVPGVSARAASARGQSGAADGEPAGAAGAREPTASP